ncbi:AfsR/SARP family transcriptional regulator [Kribbella sp. NBC_00709]|uniref:AfsR/SARP family transcriptional regulator n=1 Tax=Kribbella sp. NBC_00709 TaxID=2975972 RepID=UPI003FA5DFD8
MDLELGPSRQQGVLAVLALNANRDLTSDELLAAAWDDDPPPTGVKVVASYIYRIRAVLPCPEVLQTSPHGYLLALTTSQTDVGQLTAVLADGKAARSVGDLRCAAECYGTRSSRNSASSPAPS